MSQRQPETHANLRAAKLSGDVATIARVAVSNEAWNSLSQRAKGHFIAQQCPDQWPPARATNFVMHYEARIADAVAALQFSSGASASASF